MKKYMSPLKINSFNFSFFAFKHFKNIRHFFLRDINIICVFIRIVVIPLDLRPFLARAFNLDSTFIKPIITCEIYPS